MAKKVILVVEDDEDSRVLAERILSHYGFEVQLARTGKAGIEYCQKHRPDFILMDISLPDMSGLEVTREVRRLSGFDQVPIVAITASEMDEEPSKAGCNGFIRKPVDPQGLMAEIQKHIA